MPAFGWRIALASLTVSAGPALAADDAPIPAKSQRAPEIRLARTDAVVPIVMVKEFPFVDGSIAGFPGKLMLDTGSEQALTINDHRVPLAGGRPIGKGHFGSGQTFAVRIIPEARDIRVGNLSFPRATLVAAQDARQLEAITPDFIGWFGFDAWADHALKLNYRRSIATFYAGGPEAYLDGEHILANLSFETRNLPNHPVITAQIGTMPVVTAWDTGQYGTLFTSEVGKRRLLTEGRLTPSRTKPGTFDLHGLRIGGHVMPDVPAIAVETTPFAAAAPIGLTEPDILTIGYGLLRQYKTVWDYRQHHIYLLER
ncbi:hypothetical protein [Sphingomonas sp. PP-CE-1G-424]|uniref:hypothetical protein n=1 Tax=Sphingomonas sp. PP-CE-1G-424 TaxID=2135658 RepID=UPI001056A218|nr:hypothetical protein [Sphingomonas sp. PP-CE-1G-424]TCP64617.1 hypothetical protein C8J43_11724 [Sphingomonas sp. PP-CE-1G-424]